MQTALAHAQQNQVSTTSSPNLTASVVTALSRWNPSESLPEGLSSTTLLSAIEAQRQMLMGPSDAEVGAVCKVLLRHAEASGIKAPDTASLHATWVSHCRDMPATLLATGLAEVLKHWTNTYCLPAPGAVWDQIELPLTRMRKDLAAMQRAYDMTRDAELDPSDRAPSAETDKVIHDTLAMLQTYSHKRIY